MERNQRIQGSWKDTQHFYLPKPALLFLLWDSLAQAGATTLSFVSSWSKSSPRGVAPRAMPRTVVIYFALYPCPKLDILLDQTHTSFPQN